MVNYHLIFCHPVEKSLNSYLKDIYLQNLPQENDNIEITDLYHDNYNPISPNHDYLASELTKVRNSDVLIFQFPIYFSGFPAALHDWIIRVILEQNPSVISGKKVLISITLGGTRALYSENGGRGSLDSSLMPLFSHIFIKNNSVLLQPHVLFLEEYTNPQVFENKISNLKSKIQSFSLWPSKTSLLESNSN